MIVVYLCVLFSIIIAILNIRSHALADASSGRYAMKLLKTLFWIVVCLICPQLGLEEIGEYGPQHDFFLSKHLL